MIWAQLVVDMDLWLDENVSEEYKRQPLAQDWARVGKVIEELGEAIAKLISYTGQNPRKPTLPEDREKMLQELADIALTAVYGIQHYTKDAEETENVLVEVQLRHERRLPRYGGAG
jgi:NTP pyrophosphatase (non-canonical NTP hydrolase)